MTSCMDNYFPTAPPGDVEIVEAGGHRWRCVRVAREGEYGWSIEASPHRDDHWMPGLEEVRRRLARCVAEGMVPVAPEASGSVAPNPAAAPLRTMSTLPCSKCRAATPVTDLRGGPGKWTCAACAAPKQEEGEMKMNPMTNEERRAIVEMHDSGAGITEIVAATGRSTSSVKRVIGAAAEAGGIPPDNKGSLPITQEEAEEMARLRAGGMSFSEVAAATGRARSSVVKTMNLRAAEERGAKRAARGSAPKEQPSPHSDDTVSSLLGQLKDTVAERDAARLRVGGLERELGRREVEVEDLRRQLSTGGLEGLAAREHHAATPVSAELEELRRYRDAWLAQAAEREAERALAQARRRAAEAAALVEVTP